jgi:DNA-binding NarL/FixJ family response regulator
VSIPPCTVDLPQHPQGDKLTTTRIERNQIDGLVSVRSQRAVSVTDRGLKDAAPLTEDDVKLLALLAEGLTAETVARRMGKSERTARRRIRQLCDRLDVRTSVEAVVWAVRRGLV